MSASPEADSAPNSQSSKPEATRGISATVRLEQLKRAYQKQLGRKPTSIQKQLMERAALLTTRAEIAIYDSKTTANDVVRLDHAAQRARVEMLAAFVVPKREPEARGWDLQSRRLHLR
jgi:hypothetical protein